MGNRWSRFLTSKLLLPTFYLGLLEAVHPAEIDLLCERGVTFRMQQDYLRAEADFQLALKLAETLNDPEHQLIALQGLMDVSRTQDRHKGEGAPLTKDLVAARRYEREARDVMKAVVPPTVGTVRCLSEFGLIKMESIDPRSWRKAVELYREAGDQCQQLVAASPEDPKLINRLARVNVLIGDPLKRLRRYDEAYRYSHNAYEAYRKLGDGRGMGNATIDLGNIERARGNTDEAQKWYRQAIAVANWGGHVDQAIVDLATKQLQELGA